MRSVDGWQYRNLIFGRRPYGSVTELERTAPI